MKKIEMTAFSLAQRFRGTSEVNGKVANPLILAMLKLDDDWPQDDAVPWCSAFMNFIFWILRLPRSYSLRARSWLMVGEVVKFSDAFPAFDVVILKRGINAPGPEVIEAPGHVGLFAGWTETGDKVAVLGGNQADSVNISYYDSGRILGIRRVYL